jgi:hypothetical protein
MFGADSTGHEGSEQNADPDGESPDNGNSRGRGENRARHLAKRILDGLPATPALFWIVWIWTGVNWTVKLLVFSWILKAFSPMPYSHALLGSITGELSSVLPIHGLAGAGTYEAGIMVGLLPREMDVQAALSGAVNLHLFILGTSLLAGFGAFFLPSGAGSSSNSRDADLFSEGTPRISDSTNQSNVR